MIRIMMALYFSFAMVGSSFAMDAYYESFGFMTMIIIDGKRCDRYYVRYKDYHKEPYALISLERPFDWGEYGKVVQKYTRSLEGKEEALTDLLDICLNGEDKETI